MPNSPRQFALPLKFDSAATFANFWPGNNQQVVTQLKSLSETAATGWIYLAGAPASGVSHLLQATVNHASENGLQAIYLSLQEMLSLAGARPELSAADLMDSLELFDILCIDGIDALAGQLIWQEALFYLLVKLHNRPHACVIFGASEAPNNLGVELADLRSRLAGATLFRLKSYSDDDKASIMQRHAARRGIDLSDELARYIVQRFSRDLPDLIEAVEKLDRSAMSESRKLTIPFAKRILHL